MTLIEVVYDPLIVVRPCVHDIVRSIPIDEVFGLRLVAFALYWLSIF